MTDDAAAIDVLVASHRDFLAYVDAVQRVDVGGMPVNAYADDACISASNAGVRVFRARDALREQVIRACGTCAEHGRLDCTYDALT